MIDSDNIILHYSKSGREIVALAQLTDPVEDWGSCVNGCVHKEEISLSEYQKNWENEAIQNILQQFMERNILLVY